MADDRSLDELCDARACEGERGLVLSRTLGPGTGRGTDTIRLELRVEELDPAPSKLRGKIRFSAYMLNQADQTVCDGEWRMLLLRDRERNRRARAQKSEEQP